MNLVLKAVCLRDLLQINICVAADQNHIRHAVTEQPDRGGDAKPVRLMHANTLPSLNMRRRNQAMSPQNKAEAPQPSVERSECEDSEEMRPTD